ncbi:hypothetical protein MPSEU_000919500 [Mayamaea pseudoterrestris]|nr:hypothetical protein MPSEU_000919500 [Mayamaea pseudoterrestris]
MIRKLALLATSLLLVGSTEAFHLHTPTVSVPRRKTQQLRMAADPMLATTFVSHVSDLMHSTSLLVSDAANELSQQPPEAGGISYSKASYYTVLGLYLISFPGLWSTVSRSTKAKIKRKTFVTPGEASKDTKAMSLRQQAGEIMAYMKANNYEVIDAGETITFRGVVARSLSQAFFLTFCTALGLLSLALVLSIQFHEVQIFGMEPNWFLLALLSPYAGLYYWSSGDRVDDCTVKLSVNPDETENEIAVMGSEEELERMWKTLDWQEKGMVKIEGVLDKMQSQNSE